jgi:hypothetical protein
MPFPAVTHVSFRENRISRGTGRQKTSTKTVGTIRGINICTKTTTDDITEDIGKRGHWVIIHARAGKICWIGKVTSYYVVASAPYWDFEVANSLNDADADPDSGDETVTVTVVSPDNGPSNPLDVPTNVVSVP